MPLNYETLMGWKLPVVTQTYSVRDSMLYAISVGVSIDPIDDADYAYLYEGAGPQTLPTMATVIGQRPLWMDNPRLGINWRQIVYGEQKLQVHASLPACATITSAEKVREVYDKGPGKGALVVLERSICDQQSGRLYCTLVTSYFLRADGGFGGRNTPRAKWRPPAHPPDVTLDLPTRSDQAFIYRLNGDSNPLHVDRSAAAQAGFPAPILHGLCVFGIVARALIKTVCDHDPSQLETLEARFSAPTYPGETIRTEIWRQGKRDILFQASAIERNVVVVSNGLATLRSSNS